MGFVPWGFESLHPHFRPSSKGRAVAVCLAAVRRAAATEAVDCRAMADEESGNRLRHPNREKASSQATKTVVTLLLLASSVLIGVVLIGGWTQMQGARWLTAIYVVLYLIMAYYVFKWRRGILMMAAGAALLFVSMTAPGLPGWFERTKEGYAIGLLPAGVIGLLTVVIVIVQVLLVLAASVGFGQGWNLEIEERSQDDGGYDEDDGYGEDGSGGGGSDADDDSDDGGGHEHEPVGAGAGSGGRSRDRDDNEDQTFA